MTFAGWLGVSLLLSVPCVYWTHGADARAALESAALKRLCVPPDQVDLWRQAGFQVEAVSDAEFSAREALPAPGVTPRVAVASPTRSPWIVANGWRFIRNPAAKYSYTAPRGKGALAAAEAYAYGADAVLKIDAADVAAVGAMLSFLDTLPPTQLPAVADVGLVDDGSAVTGEVMNLLARRNLLFEVVRSPATRFHLNVAVGSARYPAAAAADPSAFALRIRRELTDERRSLRLYGSEVVIARLTGDSARVRVHLLNYGGRDIEGLRVRVLGAYPSGSALVAGAGRLPLDDLVVADGATEFSVPKVTTYAVVDLAASR